MDHYSCGGYVFSSNFDSGNLHKVELVHRDDENGESSKFSGVEFNLWTKPDCAGTEYENLNRSWFFFSIHGGEPNKVCKLNVVNLNRQTKMFMEGMRPVIRIGDSSKWKRTRDAPTYHMNGTDFVVTFLHKPQKNINRKYYYAFTFPFTYTENQSQLSRFDEIHQRSEADVDYISYRLNAVTKHNTMANQGCTTSEEDKISQFPSLTSSDKCATTTSPSESLTNMSNTQLGREIYYHRELLIHSIEKRRVDLLTITSFHNITGECEHRFSDLFPEKDTPRCRLFRNKKIIFVSSRVHPGETPASFVLNGFMKMLLDRKNKYSSILRRMYVFKIVPFLNPDGVFNGCYRSDTMGQNLNRVYLFPKIETQPSIYAVRKLIRYYHNDKELDESAQSAVSSEDVQIIFDKADVKNNNVATCSDSASSETDTELSNKSVTDKGRVSTALVESGQGNTQNVSTSSTLSHPSFPSCPEVSATTVTDSAMKMEREIIHSVSNNKNISTNFTEKCNDSNRKIKTEADNSNIFLYIDLHGHVGKNGIFMYGNHLPKATEAVECMLLPRLMSINCHHFHFDACVFSERNMYHRGRRDGLSKEGSGRVAVYKATGLIKCYTLECNFNTGNYVNMLPPRGKEPIDETIHLFPPKYTPVIFQKVGRALGPSILDLTESNPISRLPNSEFKNLQGLRNSLRNGIGHKGKRYLKSSSAYSSLNDMFKKFVNHMLTYNPSNVYAKKETATTSLSRKKGKVLCDVMPTSSSKSPDNSQVSPIPSKRPKVVTSKKVLMDNAIDLEAKLELSYGEDTTLNKKVFSSNEVPLDSPSASTSKGDTIKSASLIDPSTQPTVTFDPNTPYCSYQKLSQSTATANTIAFCTKPRKPGTFVKKSPNHTPATLIHGSTLKSSSRPKMRGSFTTNSGPSTSGHQPIRKSMRRSSLSKEGRKLKKKRKKSKVF